MPGPEQCCGGLVPAEKGKHTTALLQEGRGPGWIRPRPLSTKGLCSLRPWLGICSGTQISFSCCSQHWIANNLFGLAFSLNGVELLHLNNVSTGCILLGGLFIYDVFWVNGSIPRGGRELQPLAEGMCVALCLFRGCTLAGHTFAVRISTFSAQRGVVGMMMESNSGRTWLSKCIFF